MPDPGNAYFSALPDGPYQDLQGRPLTDAIGRVGPTLAEVVCTLLAECRLRVLMVYRWDDEAKLRRAMTHPLGMVGSDGLFRGTHPHPRGFGTHARVLAHLVRDRGWLELPDAIRRMTSMPADRYGLADRGVIRPGAAADVTVFDPDRIRDRATFDDGRATAEGVSHVFVNGKAAIESGRLSDTSAGRVLAAHVGMGLVGFLLILPGVAVIVLGISAGGTIAAVALLIGVIWIIVAAASVAALSGIYQTALYHFAVAGGPTTGRGSPPETNPDITCAG